MKEYPPKTIPPNLKTLIWLRWITLSVMFLGLLFSQLGRQWTNPSWPVLALVLLYGLSNLALSWLRKRSIVWTPSLFVFFILLLDLIFLSLLIHKTGGAENPFSILFMAICGTGAFLLNRKTLALLVLSALILLGWIYFRIPGDLAHPHHSEYQNHLEGMWIANSLGILLIVGGIAYLRAENEKKTEEYQKTKAMLFNLERIESLGRLLAATAHQLNTPLGTLQIGVSELSDPSYPLNIEERKRWAKDLQIALDQIQNILSRMHSPSVLISNDSERVELADFLAFVVKHWAEPRNQAVFFSRPSGYLEGSMGLARDLESCLLALLDNALDAKKEGTNPPIVVSFLNQGDRLELAVKDEGIGVPTEIIDQIVEPLYTTKARGTGLGLYLCHQSTRKYGGTLQIDSKVGLGTTIRLTFIKLENKAIKR